MNELKEKEKSIINQLTNILVKIIDAKEEANLVEDNKRIAIVDTMKLLNMTYSKICDLKNADAKKIFNKYQDFWFKAITNAKKQIKFPLLDINTGLWRVYLFTLFKSKNQEELLEELTGWNYKSFQREVITHDMKLILLSIANIEESKIEEENISNNKKEEN